MSSYWQGIEKQNLTASVFMLMAAVAFAGMNVIIRMTADYCHISLVMAVRSIVGIVILLPWALKQRSSAFTSQVWRLHFLRALFGTLAMAALFWSLILLPVAEAVTLTFTLPMFGLIGAVLFLGEQVGIRRWSATLVGFLGVVLIMRPGSATLQLAAFVAIFSAICMAGSGLSVKALTQHGEKGTKVVFIFGLLSTPVILIYAGLNLAWPGWYAVMLMLMVGVLGGLGQTCLANAYQRADASLVMALDFLRLPFVIVAGFIILGEVPALAVLPGMVLIIGSAFYIGQREARLKGRG